jgi:glycosyltransferase involved in cell wall biosynthesis
MLPVGHCRARSRLREHEPCGRPTHASTRSPPSIASNSVVSIDGISPRFSIITPVYDPPLGAFQACIDGVRSQTLTDWEWCVVDDGSTQPEIRAVLESAAADDPRIRVECRYERWNRRRIQRRAGNGPRRVRRLLDHDDLLAPTALEHMASTIDVTPDIDYVYSDETHVHADGTEFAHFPKPDWSPERFRSSMYTCHSR